MSRDTTNIQYRQVDSLVAEQEVENEAASNHKEGFGSKTIGPSASTILLWNNITGAGIASLPLIYQQAGWFFPSIVMLFASISSAIGSLMICEAMRYVPANEGFRDRIEFSSVVKFYFGKKFYYVVQLFLNLSLQSLNVVSIIETSQVMDTTIMAIFHGTGGLEFYPTFGWVWVTQESASTTPFGDNVYIISIGFVVTLALVIPLGYLNLDDNIIVQQVCFFLTLSLIGSWFVDFGRIYNRGTVQTIPMFGINMAPVFGTVLFNFGFVTTVPSWCNEKKPSVNIHYSVWGATTLATIVYSSVGIAGALAFKIPSDGDLLSTLTGDPTVTLFSQISVYAFPIVCVASSVPVYSIIVRYNLLENKIFSKGWANFWAVVFPWIVAVPFYTGKGLVNVINWSSLFLGGFTNFVLPFLIYIKARNYRDGMNDQRIQDVDNPIMDDLPPTPLCFGACTESNIPAPTHFTFSCCSCVKTKAGPKFTAAVIAIQFTIMIVGVIIINIWFSG